MKIRPLFEEWQDYVKTNEGRAFPVYTNPNSKDYTAMRKENDTEKVRYILRIYGEPILYVFDYRLLHSYAAEALGIPYKSRVHLPIWGDYAFGESKIENNSISLTGGIVAELGRMGKKNIPYEFLNTYFNNAPKRPEKKERKRIFRS